MTDPTAPRPSVPRAPSSEAPISPPTDPGPGTPVPITVWHVPEPVAGTVLSAQLTRRLVVNYTRPDTIAVDLTTGRPSGGPDSGAPVALVITGWPLTEVSAEEHLAACAARLTTPGCVAVVVTNAQIPDQLGRLVTAARAAGLTYVQHVVAAHHLAPRPLPDPGRHERRRPATGERHLRVHTDVLLFLQNEAADG